MTNNHNYDVDNHNDGNQDRNKIISVDRIDDDDGNDVDSNNCMR